MKKQSKLFNAIDRGNGLVSLLLYGDVGDYGDIKSEAVVSELMALEAQYSSINVHINSPGGDVFTGIAIYNALRASKANITIYIDGIAASIAGIIALCGKPLYMSQYARLMLHRVSGGAYGTAKELRDTADLIEGLEQTLSEMVAKRIGQDAEAVKARYFTDGKDHWLSAKEALELGIIDGIRDLPEAEELNEASTNDEIYKIFNNRLALEAQNPNTKDMALLDDIKTVQGFTNASEANVVDLLREQATKLEALENANAEKDARIAELEEKELTTLVNTAVADGRITEAQRQTYLNLLKSDRTNTEKLLESLPKTSPKPSNRTARLFTEGGGRKVDSFESKSWDELDKAGQLANFKAQNPEAFAEAYKAKFGVDYNF